MECRWPHPRLLSKTRRRRLNGARLLSSRASLRTCQSWFFSNCPFVACTLDMQLKGADCMTGSIWRCGTGWLSRQPSSSARALKFRCSLLIFYLTFLPYAWPAYLGLACNTSTVQVTCVAQLLVSHLQQRVFCAAHSMELKESKTNA